MRPTPAPTDHRSTTGARDRPAPLHNGTALRTAKPEPRVSSIIARAEATPMAEARQFYLEDWGAEGNSAEVWTGRSLENHFGTVPGLVAVATGSQDRVPVLIEVWDGEPADDVELHDHVGETSLEVRSGRLVVSECQGDPRLVEVIVKAGWYRVRIACDKLASADEDGHADSSRCQLWPAPPSPDLVL